jgi:hypothetical protein
MPVVKNCSQIPPQIDFYFPLAISSLSPLLSIPRDAGGGGISNIHTVYVRMPKKSRLMVNFYIPLYRIAVPCAC